MLALVGSGLSNQEIAEPLVISPATAKTHVSRTMMKLHAHDRAQLVVIAYETGLVRIPWYLTDEPPGGTWFLSASTPGRYPYGSRG